MHSFPNLEPVHCSMSSSNCCFLTWIQISQEAGQVVWYSHLFKNFPQFLVIHTVKRFGIVNKAEVYVFLEISCFFVDPMDVGNLISGSSSTSKTVEICLDNVFNLQVDKSTILATIKCSNLQSWHIFQVFSFSLISFNNV